MGKIIDSLIRKTAKSVNTGRWFFKAFSGNEAEAIEAEYAMGYHLAREISRQVPLDSRSDEAALIQETGRRLAVRLTNKQRKFHFAVMNAPELNAFALPGGFIFVTRRLIELCRRDENMLAFVLGHEMGHVVKGHALDRMVAGSAIKIIANLGPGRGLAGNLSRKAISGLLYSNYSRDQELEADSFGVGIMDAARYPAAAAADFMGLLRDSAGVTKNSTLEKYFSTHPDYVVRIRNIQKTVRRLS